MSPEWGRYDQAKADADIAVHAALATGIHGVGSGTVVGTDLTQTLTAKTLTSPVIQGTVGAGTGLTMPAFIAGGDITLGANKLKTTSCLLKEQDIYTLVVRNLTDSTKYNFSCADFTPTSVIFRDPVDSVLTADTVKLTGYELSAGHRALAIGCEEPVVSEVVVSDTTLQVRINGVTYKICLKA